MHRGNRGGYTGGRPPRIRGYGHHGGSGFQDYGGHGYRGHISRGGGGSLRPSHGGGYRGDYRDDHRGRGRGGGYRGGYGGNHHSPHRSTYPPPTENEKYIFRKGNGNHYPRSVKTSVPFKRLAEPDVGITEYISTHEGFNGIIKQRFSDFHVNEVDSKGNVVILENLEVPELKHQDTITLEEVLPKETVDKLRTLLTDFGRNNKVEIDVSAMPKDERKRIHIAIRGEFGDKLNSNTKTTGETKILLIARSDKTAKQDVRLPWPEDRPGKYLHFVLYKENLDTMDAVNYIASRFKMNPSMVTYAGTKDKRAMTSQSVAMYKVEPSRLIEKCLKQKRITFGNFEFKPEPLKLGGLLGNRFRITLRNVTGTDEQIQQSMTSLKENGFINYYGLQRFGNNSEVPTYEIGRELLLGNWKKVVELILKPRRNDSNLEVNHARQVWWETGRANQAFNIMNRQDYSIEGKLLSGLIKRGESNFVDALENVPRNTRLLYLHAYQSLVWNKVVSRRIKEFGLKPIVGDLVLLAEIKSEVFFDVVPEAKPKGVKKTGADKPAIQEKAAVDGSEATEGKEETTDGSEVKEGKEETTDGSKVKEGKEETTDGSKVKEGKEPGDVEITDVVIDEAKSKKEEPEEVEITDVIEEAKDKKEDNGVSVIEVKESDVKIPEKLSKRPAVKSLTEEDLVNYTIGDIILPLPGFDVVFPDNCVKEWYEEYLKPDGLSIAGMKQKVKKYSLGGAYRKLVIVPENFTWHTMRYSDPDKALILSDLEKINKVAEPEDEPEGKYQALLLDFQLPSSAYATMALRDILKRDTSTSYQSTLNTYHEKKDKDGDSTDGSQKRKEGGEDETEESSAKKTKVDEDNGGVEVIALEGDEGDDGDQAQDEDKEAEVEEVMEVEDDDVAEVDNEK